MEQPTQPKAPPKGVKGGVSESKLKAALQHLARPGRVLSEQESKTIAIAHAPHPPEKGDAQMVHEEEKEEDRSRWRRQR